MSIQVTKLAEKKLKIRLGEQPGNFKLLYVGTMSLDTEVRFSSFRLVSDCFEGGKYL